MTAGTSSGLTQYLSVLLSNSVGGRHGPAASALGFLRQPKHFSALTKVLYADEWAESVEDAFGSASETACVAAALELHYEEARRLESGMCVQLLKLLRETLPLHA